MAANVKRILSEWLEQNGYDGLCTDGCGCDIDNLLFCDGPADRCEPGYRYHCARCYKGPLLFGTCEKASENGWMVREADWCKPVYVDPYLYDRLFKEALVELDMLIPYESTSRKWPALLGDQVSEMAMQKLRDLIKENMSADAEFDENGVCQFPANTIEPHGSTESGEKPAQRRVSP